MNQELQSELYKEFISQDKYENFMHFLINKIETYKGNANLKTLSCVCHGCGIQYEITFNEQEYYEPECCAGCGIDDETLEITVK